MRATRRNRAAADRVDHGRQEPETPIPEPCSELENSNVERHEPTESEPHPHEDKHFARLSSDPTVHIPPGWVGIAEPPKRVVSISKVVTFVVTGNVRAIIAPL